MEFQISVQPVDASKSELQLGFEGREVPGRALFVQSNKNECTVYRVYRVMCVVSRYVTKYNPIPQ